MPARYDSVFRQLRELLGAHANGLTVVEDTPTRYSLAARAGPASIAAWRGQVRRETIPVAWVEHGSAYVSLHLMSLTGNPPLVARLTPTLRARLHGKTCFNFRELDEALVKELDTVTADAIDGLERAGFIVARHTDASPLSGSRHG